MQERKHQGEYEEFLKEKLMIDEIVRKIYEEDQRYTYIQDVRRVLEEGLSLSLTGSKKQG